MKAERCCGSAAAGAGCVACAAANGVHFRAHGHGARLGNLCLAATLPWGVCACCSACCLRCLAAGAVRGCCSLALLSHIFFSCSACRLSPSAARKRKLCIYHGLQDFLGVERAVLWPAQLRLLSVWCMSQQSGMHQHKML